jgi:hypothetical protein
LNKNLHIVYTYFLIINSLRGAISKHVATNSTFNFGQIINKKIILDFYKKQVASAFAYFTSKVHFNYTQFSHAITPIPNNIFKSFFKFYRLNIFKASKLITINLFLSKKAFSNEFLNCLIYTNQLYNFS